MNNNLNQNQNNDLPVRVVISKYGDIEYIHQELDEISKKIGQLEVLRKACELAHKNRNKDIIDFYFKLVQEFQTIS